MAGTRSDQFEVLLVISILVRNTLEAISVHRSTFRSMAFQSLMFSLLPEDAASVSSLTGRRIHP